MQAQYDPNINLRQEADGFYLDITVEKTWSEVQSHQLITTGLLEKAITPDLPFEQPDGSSYCIRTDYFGRNRVLVNPFPGPFEFGCFVYGKQTLKLWPVEKDELASDFNNDCVVDIEDLLIFIDSWLTTNN